MMPLPRMKKNKACLACHGSSMNYHRESDSDTCEWCAGLGVALTPEQLFLPVSAMQAACPNPCSDCPFRKNSLPGWLGDWLDATALSSHVLSNKYPCHMTMPDRSEYEDMGTDEPLDDSLIDDLILHDSTQCRGSILYKEKHRAAAYKIGEVGPEHENILAPNEFLAYHNRR